MSLEIYRWTYKKVWRRFKVTLIYTYSFVSIIQSHHVNNRVPRSAITRDILTLSKIFILVAALLNGKRFLDS